MKRRALITGTISALGIGTRMTSASVQSEEVSTMINVIPAPHHVELADQGSLIVDNAVAIVAQDGTEGSRDWLVGGLEKFAGISLDDQNGSATTITMRVDNTLEPALTTTGIRPDGGTVHDEGYSITVDESGVDIVGVSAEAAFRGATTLLQMVANDGEIPFGTITDAPRFAWRGLSFDTVRCFHSVETVEKVLDLLALYKLNVFHFHLTDSEGWRFPVDGWPLLTEVSGQTARDDRPGGYYTPEEFTHIVQYAAERYILVVPEFDSPGHTASVITAYPEMASDEIRAMDPAMQYLHPDQPRVPELLRDVYTAMAEQTTADFIHIGGDEAIAMDHETFKQYIQLAAPIARETGKNIVAWQEAARGGLSEGDLVQWWIPHEMVEKMKRAHETGEGLGSRDPNDPVMKAFIELFSTADEDIPAALEQGASVIISPAKWLYLDTKYTEDSADPSQKETHERLGMPPSVYSNGTVEDSYDWDPATAHGATPIERIAGVEAAIWCEFIASSDDLFFQLLPRLAGSAEKAWSEAREWEDHRDRLATQPRFWDALGVPYFKSSVVW